MPDSNSQIKLPKIGAAQIQLLESLCNACAVSGDEREVRKIVLEQLKPVADEVRVDALGNVLVIRRATDTDQQKPPLRVMLAAHMDEVGFMITADDGDGYYRFNPVGGVDTRHLPGKPVWIGNDHVLGVIGAKPIHLTTPSERRSVISLDNLRMDVSPNGKKIKPGDRATFGTSFSRQGPSLRAKALDDRLGVATLIELVKNPPVNIELLAAFTVQEEVGLRGAQVAAYTFNPDIAIALDCTPAYDLPTWDNEENTQYNTRLDAGPAIYVADGATLSDPRLIRHFVNTAESHKIPYQFRQAGGGSTDAGTIHKQRGGIPSISISVPGRYLHTAASIVRLSDWQHTFQLVYTALHQLTPDIFAQER
jgi:tetrahedral aminopeptidase